MTTAERRAQDQPRATVTWQFQCYADDAYFVPFDATLAHHQALAAELEAHNGLPCGDGIAGAPGPWCCDCRFGADAAAEA